MEKRSREDMMKRFLFLLAKLTVSLGLMYLLYRKMPLSDMEELMLSLDLRYMPYVFAILLANTFLSAWKWHILLKSDGVEISLLTLTGSYLIGSFLNMFLPSNIGGDSYRVIDTMRRSKDTMRSATSVFADRLSGFLALVILSLISSLFVVLKTRDMFFFYLPLGIFFLLVSLIWALYNQNVMRKMVRMVGLHKFAVLTENLEKLFSSFSRYGSRFDTVAKVMAISFSFQSLVIVIVFLLAKSLGVSISFFYFSAFVPLITLMEALPVSIYGVGVRDIGYVFFFGSIGMGDLQTRSLAVLFFVMAIVYSLFGGIVLLIRILFPDTAAEKK
jgi:glycosyltransferase 2 family protein